MNIEPSTPTELFQTDLDQVNGGFTFLGVDIGYSNGQVTATVSGYGVGVGLDGGSLKSPKKSGPESIGTCSA